MNRMIPSQASKLLIFLLDFLVLFTLWSTGEIHSIVWMIVVGLLLVSYLIKWRMPNPLLFGVMVAIVVGCIYVWSQFHYPALLIVAHAAPLIHSVLWLSQQKNRERLLRLGIGFVELLLISVITAELYLSIAIFAFSVLASLAISCHFLEQEYHRYESLYPDLNKQRLPKSFLKNSFTVSFLTLLSSLLIFPLLPRTDGGLGVNLSQQQTGYTEEVNLTNPDSIAGEGGGATVMRIYAGDSFLDPEKISFYIYLGLIRGKILARFDGTTWTAGIRRRAQITDRDLIAREKPPFVNLEIIREPMKSDVLPLPYGAVDVLMTEGESYVIPALAVSGERIARRQTRRISYRLKLADGFSGNVSSEPDVNLDHTYVPEAMRTDRMKRLSERIGKGAKNSFEKIQRIRNFFLAEGFQPTTNLGELRTPGLDALRSQMNPIEQFLFLDKAGHCELFASSMAVLLRMLGIPTRLIAGFRLSRSPVGGVLTIRSGDAHAWLEAWVTGRGWMILDPTPRVMGSAGLFESLRQSYELLSAYWYRYVVSFDSKKQMDWGSQAIGTLRVSSAQKWKNKSFFKFSETTLLIGSTLVIGLLMLILVFLVTQRLKQDFKRSYRISLGSLKQLKRQFLLLYERYRFESVLKRQAKLKPHSLNYRDDVWIELTQDWDRQHDLNRGARGSLTKEVRDWLETYYVARFSRSSEMQGLESLRQKTSVLKQVLRTSQTSQTNQSA